MRRKYFLNIIIVMILACSFLVFDNIILIHTVEAAESYYTVAGTKNYLALRASPRYDESNEIGKLYNGETVQYVNSGNGSYWYVYSSKLGQYGYVNSKYLIGSSSPSYTNSSPATSGNTYTVVGTKNYLALRSVAEYNDNNIIGKLYNGDTVQVQNTSGRYWYVYSSKLGMSGFVNSQYLAPSGGGSAPVPVTTGGNTYKVTGAKNYLALRSAAVYDDKNEIGRLYNGDSVEVQNSSGTYWYVYSSKLGKSGYVNARYLTPYY